MQDCCRSCRDKSIDNDRNTLNPCCQHSAAHGSNFAPAEASQRFQSVGFADASSADCTADHIGLALQTCRVNAGSGADPVFRTAAIQRMKNRRSNRGIGNAHFSDAQ